MSFETAILVNKSNIPSQADWQDAINTTGFALKLDDFNPLDFEGFLPCEYAGLDDVGFEYYLEPVDDEMVEEFGAELLAQRDHVVILVTRSSFDDLICAEICAATLCQLADGLWLVDEEEKPFETAQSAMQRLQRTVPEFLQVKEELEANFGLPDHSTPEEFTQGILEVLNEQEELPQQLPMRFFIYVAEQQIAERIQAQYGEQFDEIEVQESEAEDGQWLCLLTRNYMQRIDEENLLQFAQIAFEIAETFEGDLDGWELKPDFASLDEVNVQLIAQDILQDVVSGFPGEVEFQPAEWSKVETAIKAQYDAKKVEFEALGFQFVADFEDMSVVAQGAHIPLSGFWHPQHKITAAYYVLPGDPIGTTDLEAYFEEEQVNLVTTASEIATFTENAKINTVHLPAETPLNQQLDVMCSAIADSEQSGLNIQQTAVDSFERIVETQNLLARLKLQGAQEAGWVSLEWIQQSIPDEEQALAIYSAIQELLEKA